MGSQATPCTPSERINLADAILALKVVARVDLAGEARAFSPTTDDVDGDRKLGSAEAV